jgi:signal transduction histidine kinase
VIRRRWLPNALLALYAVATITYLWLYSSAGRSVSVLDALPINLAYVAFAAVGWLVCRHQPSNAVGWLLSAVAIGTALGNTAQAYADYATETSPARLPAANYAAWFGAWLWPLSISLLLLVVLLYPTGRPLNPRWRFVFRGAAVSLVLMMLPFAFAPGDLDSGGHITNPFGIESAAGLIQFLTVIAMPAAVATLVAAAVSLVVRSRRARGDERQQLKWLGYAVFFMIAIMVAGGVIGAAVEQDWISNLTFSVGIAALPIAIGIAILKYRLYDIDVIINKTIVFGGLAVFITGIYVAIVVGIGTALGSSDKPNLALSIAATAVVAIAFSPVKERVQRLANRLVYGKRATPYEALAAFTDKVATSYESEEVAPAMAKTIAEATGAATAQVWLAIDHTLVPAAIYPDNDDPPLTVSLNEDKDLTEELGADITAPVTYQGELLGAIALDKKKGEEPRPEESRLLKDLASQAAVVLRNTRLTAELRARLDDISRLAKEIKDSRARIVAAQDKERRRLERDIHDGAQQHLVALAVKLNLAKTMAQRKPERAKDMLDQLETEMAEALETLSDLAKGIYPPLLAQEGIAHAIEARAQKAPFAVAIQDHTSARFDAAVEAAVYFCCLEALQNVAKYANAQRAEVTLDDQDASLVFTVTDDGSGFDPATTDPGSGIAGMADRAATVGGTVEVTSQPGQGTTVTGRIPIREKASVPQ